MKTCKPSRLLILCLLTLLLSLSWTGSALANRPAQGPAPMGGGGPGQIGTGFSYQGELKNAGAPVNGTCDLQFSLWDSSGSGTPPAGGTQIGSTDLQTGVSVANGLFTVTLNYTGQFGTSAFQGDMRYLQISVRCPAGTGSYTTLAPRQMVSAVPYAMGLVPGTRMQGDAYQTLKIMNDTTQTGVPAGVTGEITASVDGVGLYGSNTVTTAGATGMGVWGRTWSPNGVAVKANGYNGANGIFVTGSGIGTTKAAAYVENTDTTAGTPAGIALYALNNSGDATIVARNMSTGDAFRVINAANTGIVFSISNTGNVWANHVTTYGADLAENFPVNGNGIEPGMLLVIDPDNPGMLKPSTSAYDSKVAGVVSGAGGVESGFVLSQADVLGGSTPIAIAGRVYVKAEALSGPIRPGDLLTTSNLPGTAMKASDRSLAVGAIIGKAMTALDSGTGLVLVLISLQ